MDSDIQNQIGNNTTKSTPFVTAGGWVWFQGTDNKLYKVFNDGTQLSRPGANDAASTPFVTPDGWVWFQGANNELYKMFNDGSQQSRPGANDTLSSPTVVGDWVYFRGPKNELFRMNTAGSQQTQIGKQTTKSTPFVTPDGWVWFQGTNGQLLKIFNDGTQLSRPGANDAGSSPTVVNNVVYWQGQKNELFRMNPDGSGQTQIGKQTTKSTPFVTADGWVYFQGTDDHLYRVFNDGTQLSRPGANDTYSTPVVGQVEISEGTVGEWIYFQSVNNQLTRLFQPVAPIATGTMQPKYYILTVLYAPPGMNGGSAVSSVLGNVVSSVNYSSGSSTGTTTSISSSFKDGISIEASAEFNIGIYKLGGGAQFNASTTTSDQSSETITSSTTFTQNVPGPGEDGINHDHDMFVLMLNPLVGVAIYPGNIMQWTMGVNGPVMNIQFPYVGWLKDPSTMPPGVKQQLDAAGLTAADYTQILAANPFAQGATAIDPNRFLATPQTYPYQPPFSASDPVFTNTITLQNAVNVADTHTVQNQHSVSVSVSAGIEIPVFKASLKVTGSLEWTSTNAYGTSSTSTQTAAATVGGPAFGYSGPTDVVVYWDTLYSSFLFAFPSEPPTASGTLVDAAGKAVANQAVTLTVGGHTFKTFTNSQGQYRFYGAPAGQGSLAASGQNIALTVGAGAAPPTLRLR